MSTRDNYYLFGDLERDPKTKPCRFCKGSGYRLVHSHIEVECIYCKGHGFVVTNVIKDKLNKDPHE